MVCEVLVELAHVFVDKTFTYLIPDALINKVLLGMRVKVPFKEQTLEGFVLSIHEKKDDIKLKEIISLVDSYSILNNELLELGKHISKSTISSLMASYQVMLPKALKAKNKIDMKPKTEKYVKLNLDYDKNIKFNTNQLEIIKLLEEQENLKKNSFKSISSVNTLIKKKVLFVEEQEVYRYNLDDVKTNDFELNEEQKIAYDEIVNNLGSNLTYLIHGVTGSGKTNLYMKIINKVINNGKTAIVLVPEISLTPQIISKFTSMFSRIAILHSGLSDGEKYDEWRKIKEGNVDIVIGARSAIFAPLDNIGVIIIDEEHSSTYKQENIPRYHAIDIAKERCKYHNSLLILGSATPSLESYARGEKDVYKLLVLKERFNKKALPKVSIIDMNSEFKKSNSYFSNPLISEINNSLERDEQVILFLNRRGYSSQLVCKNCGYVEKCPNCEISLTYHKSSNMLRCHYCGYANKRSNLCSSCNEELVDIGLGTEKVEEELKLLVPLAKIVRMDVDTTSKKNAHAKIINDFMDGKHNILLGTQMIAKGLDFPNVTLVGVINADTSLNIPDFRSSENTFQLLNQVSGRSGRGEKEGKVLIQTFNPMHYAIRYTINNDYLGFYKEEMNIRKELKYPPYYYLCMIRVISFDYDKASDGVSKISSFLKDKLSNNIILGPSVCNPFKLNKRYRFGIIIKYKNFNEVDEVLNEILNHYFNNKDLKVEIDVNPVIL